MTEKKHHSTPQSFRQTEAKFHSKGDKNHTQRRRKKKKKKLHKSLRSTLGHSHTQVHHISRQKSCRLLASQHRHNHVASTPSLLRPARFPKWTEDEDKAGCRSVKTLDVWRGVSPSGEAMAVVGPQSSHCDSRFLHVSYSGADTRLSTWPATGMHGAWLGGEEVTNQGQRAREGWR